MAELNTFTLINEIKVIKRKLVFYSGNFYMCNNGRKNVALITLTLLQWYYQTSNFYFSTNNVTNDVSQCSAREAYIYIYIYIYIYSPHIKLFVDSKLC